MTSALHVKRVKYGDAASRRTEELMGYLHGQEGLLTVMYMARAKSRGHGLHSPCAAEGSDFKPGPGQPWESFLAGCYNSKIKFKRTQWPLRLPESDIVQKQEADLSALLHRDQTGSWPRITPPAITPGELFPSLLGRLCQPGCS